VGAPVDTWEDWLNEGFAEYFSLRAVRQRFGEEALGEIVQKKRERIQGLPPVRDVQRTSEQAHSVLYDKASLLLLDLAEEVGQAVFDAVVREFCRLEQKDTGKFLKILERHAGEHAARELDCRLNQ
jgi:aminopeptidase N